MRSILLAALLVAGQSHAQDFLAGDALKADVEKRCGSGCVVMTPEQAQDLLASIQMLIAQKAQEAFDAGRKHERESCRNVL